MPDRIVKSDAEWRQLLTTEQYEVARKKGTELAFTGKYYNFKGIGTYQCACCGNHLFSSETKYDSGTGWPSFWAPLSEQNITTAIDTSAGMIRTEVMCQRCGAHLGHLFNDGPSPTGLRFCLNSISMKFAAGMRK